MNEPKSLQTAGDVIDALGGTGATQSLIGRKWAQSVSNWRKNNRLPADTFLILTRELARLGFTAPAALWGIAEPAEAAE